MKIFFDKCKVSSLEIIELQLDLSKKNRSIWTISEHLRAPTSRCMSAIIMAPVVHEEFGAPEFARTFYCLKL